MILDLKKAASPLQVGGQLQYFEVLLISDGRMKHDTDGQTNYSGRTNAVFATGVLP